MPVKQVRVFEITKRMLNSNTLKHSSTVFMSWFCLSVCRAVTLIKIYSYCPLFLYVIDVYSITIAIVNEVCRTYSFFFTWIVKSIMLYYAQWEKIVFSAF